MFEKSLNFSNGVTNLELYLFTFKFKNLRPLPKFECLRLIYSFWDYPYKINIERKGCSKMQFKKWQNSLEVMSSYPKHPCGDMKSFKKFKKCYKVTWRTLKASDAPNLRLPKMFSFWP